MKEKLSAWLSDNSAYFFLIIIIGLIVYANAFLADFISDDIPAIVNNPNINSLAEVFKQPLNPTQPLLYFVAYKIGGLNPFIYHLMNVLFHLAVSLAVFALTSFFYEKRLALIVAVIFTVHPVLTESVIWISGGNYVRYSFFFLVSLIFYHLSKKTKIFYFLAIASFLLSILSSEKALSLPLVFVAYEMLMANRPPLHNFQAYKPKIISLLPFFIIAAVHFAVIFFQIENRQMGLSNIQYAQSQLYNYNPILQIPVAVISYLRLIFWPDQLTVYHSEIYSYNDTYIMTAVFSVFILLYFYSLKTSKLVFFWLSIFFISLLPTLTPLNVASSLAERYLYLGSLGIIAPTVATIYQFRRRWQYQKTVSIAFLVIIILLAARTIVRSNDYRSFENFWMATLRTSPTSYQAHNNVGIILAKRGDYDNALKEFKQSLAIVPNNSQSNLNIASIYFAKKDYDQALQYYETAVKLNPNQYLAYQNMAAIYYKKKEYDKSLALTQKALQLYPNNVNLLANLSLTYIKKGDKKSAKEVLEKILIINPTNIQAQQELQKLK